MIKNPTLSSLLKSDHFEAASKDNLVREIQKKCENYFSKTGVPHVMYGMVKVRSPYKPTDKNFKFGTVVLPKLELSIKGIDQKIQIKFPKIEGVYIKDAKDIADGSLIPGGLLWDEKGKVKYKPCIMDADQIMAQNKAELLNSAQPKVEKIAKDVVKHFESETNPTFESVEIKSSDIIRNKELSTLEAHFNESYKTDDYTAAATQIIEDLGIDPAKVIFSCVQPAGFVVQWKK